VLAPLKPGESSAILELAAQIQDELNGLVIDSTFLDALKKTIASELKTDCYSVRSSVLFEDGEKASFAGLFHTSLNVKAHDLEQAIIDCIKAVYHPNVLQYSLLHGINPAENPVSLIVQDMVDASVSGICFSMDASGNFNDMMISGGLGSGEGVVSNHTDTSSYLIDRQNQNISVAHGLPEVLTQEQLRDLYTQGMAIEKLFAFPQDIEFSYDNENKLYILQSRPITTIDIRNLKILDNTNIVESYPGITLPLSFTFARNGYQQVFTAAARLFSVSEKNISILEPKLSSMIAHIEGRVYYNLHNWYSLMQMVIADENALKAWETLIGIKSAKKSTFSFSVIKKIKTTCNSLILFIRYPKIVKVFYQKFQSEYGDLRQYANQLYENKPTPKEVFLTYEHAAAKLFKNWAATLLNDFFTFRFFDALKRMIQSYKIPDSENLSNDLLCGIPGVESERPILELLRMKAFIQADELLSLLFKKDSSEIAHLIHSGYHPAFKSMVDTYIQLYGDRTLEELKLESPNFRMNTTGIYDLLKSQLKNVNTAESFIARQDDIRQQAEQKIRSKLKPFSPKTILFNYVLKHAKESIKNRENMRLRRAMSYGAVKEMFFYLGHCMQENKIIDEAMDVFYLHIEELRAWCFGDHVLDFKSIIAERKQSYKTYKDLKLPDRIVYNELLPSLANKGSMIHQDGVMQGTGISRGLLTAEALVMHQPDLSADADGKILVTRITDPAWVFLMARAGGIITEKGSPLSHTAIVGRELGIPVIIGVNNATTLIKNGEMIRMNGDTGLLETVIGK